MNKKIPKPGTYIKDLKVFIEEAQEKQNKLLQEITLKEYQQQKHYSISMSTTSDTGHYWRLKDSIYSATTSANDTGIVQDDDTDMRIGVVIGRFAPFHSGHVLLYDSVLQQEGFVSDIVYVVVLGKQGTKKNPFSFELRKKIVEESIAHPYTIKGNVEVLNGFDIENPGYVPSILRHIVTLKNYGMKSINRYKKIFHSNGDVQIVEDKDREPLKTKFIVACGDDRYDDYLGQIERDKKNDKSDFYSFNKLNFVKFGRAHVDVSSTQIRDMIQHVNSVKDIEHLMTHQFRNNKNKELLFNQMLNEINNF